VVTAVVLLVTLRPYDPRLRPRLVAGNVIVLLPIVTVPSEERYPIKVVPSVELSYILYATNPEALLPLSNINPRAIALDGDAYTLTW